MDCLGCRSQGVNRQYHGESSRSGYQRGKEHEKDVEAGVLKHPKIQHFWEDHGGVRQDILTRITSKHFNALERQVKESVIIEKAMAVENECLNGKSEWAGSKLLSMAIKAP